MITVDNVANKVKNLLISQGQDATVEKINDISYLICSELVGQGKDVEGEFAVWCSGPMLESLSLDQKENDDITETEDIISEVNEIYDEIMKQSYSNAEFSLMTSLYDEAWNRAYAEKKTHIPWSYVK